MDEPNSQELFHRLDYQFRDLSLFKQALTHKSYANENPDRSEGDNERLEFLGDAVLEFVISNMLMEAFPHLSEGELSKIRASLVSEPSLAAIALELKLGRHLLMGKGEIKSGGPQKNSILSDGLEAIFAAVYLDSREQEGVGAIARVIHSLFQERVRAAEQDVGSSDYKTKLQEIVQNRYKDTVEYIIVQEAGPDHEKQFVAAVTFKQSEIGRGEGRSKKQAEQAAAKQALDDYRSGILKIDL
jgi:ribonuclease III